MGREPDSVDSATEGDADDETEGGVVERLATDAAFELLSDETRLDILRALYDAPEPRSFSALHDAVDVRDSGQFNYHLDKLRAVFVTKGADGYELTAAGVRVVGAILAGRYTKTIDAPPVSIDADCTHCGESLVGVFEGELARVTCEGCDRNLISLHVPPGAFEEYPREEWPLVAEQWTRQEFRTVKSGFCPFCYGPMGERIVRDPERLVDVFDAAVGYYCSRCGEEMFSNVEASVASHPAVVAFHHEHGVDVGATPVWELEWAVEPNAEITSEDPLRVEVPVELDGDRLVLRLDESASVVETRRE